MLFRRLLACAGALALLCFALPGLSQMTDNTTVELAVVEGLMKSEQGDFLKRTIARLENGFKAKQLNLRVTQGSLQQVRSLVEHNRVDFFIAPSSLYRRLLLTGCSAVAVTHATKTTNPNRAQGSLFLTRLGEQPDVGASVRLSRVMRLTADRELDLTNIRGELRKHGYGGQQTADLANKMRSVSDTDENIGSALELLRDGVLDVLILPVCRLERFCKQNSCPTTGLAELWPKQDMDMECFHSTQLYPGTTLAVMPSLSPSAHREILSVVFSMPAGVRGQSWSVASNFQSVDETLRLLDDDILAQVRKSSIDRFWEKWRDWFYFGVLAVALFVFYAVTLQVLVRRKTRQLRIALIEQKKARRETEIISRRLDRMQRLQTIGQLASLFAHELGQPLNAIGCYAHGIGKATEGFARYEAVKTGLKGIEAQVERASAIVRKVRDYVRSQTVRTNLIALDRLVSAAVENFKITSLGNIPIIVDQDDVSAEHFLVRGDPLELELVVNNLLRNASQAQRQIASAQIRVRLLGEVSPGFTVTDNGIGLTEEKLAAMIRSGESTRPEGLGLGLSIVRNLVEQHDGDIRFSLTPRGGLCVCVIFPAAGGTNEVKTTEKEAQS